MSGLRRDVASDDEEYLSGQEGEIEFSESSDDESYEKRRSPSRSSGRSRQSQSVSSGRPAGLQPQGASRSQSESPSPSSGSAASSLEEGEIERQNVPAVAEEALEASQQSVAPAKQKPQRKPREPFEVPTSGRFWLHDDRFNSRSDNQRPSRPQKLWDPTAGEKWAHDKFDLLDLPPEEDTYQGFLQGKNFKKRQDQDAGTDPSPPGFSADAAPSEQAGRGRGARRGRGRGQAALQNGHSQAEGLADQLGGLQLGEAGSAVNGRSRVLEVPRAQLTPLAASGDWLAEEDGPRPGQGAFLVANPPEPTRMQARSRRQQNKASKSAATQPPPATAQAPAPAPAPATRTRLNVSAKDYQPVAAPTAHINGVSTEPVGEGASTAGSLPNPAAVPFNPAAVQLPAGALASEAGPLVVEGFPVMQPGGGYLQALAPPFQAQQQAFVPGPMQQSLAAPPTGSSTALQRPVRRPITIVPSQQPSPGLPSQHQAVLYQAPPAPPSLNEQQQALLLQQHQQQLQQQQQLPTAAAGIPAGVADGGRRAGVRRYSAIAGQI